MVIEAQGVSLTFQTNDGPIHALKNVDLTIDRGEFVSFIGPSGCGKTTFLRTIAALETPTSGRISVNGLDADEARRARAYGYVFQAPGLYPWRTISGNISLPLEIMGFSKPDREIRIARVLELVELSGFGGKFPWQLSGGMQQRASICRALLHDPALLLMDEPFGALDAMTREKMNLELQRIWAESRKTVLLITHSIPEAIFLSDRVLVMSERPGSIAAVYDIDLPRMRSLDVMGSPEFAKYAKQIRAHFFSEGILDH